MSLYVFYFLESICNIIECKIAIVYEKKYKYQRISVVILLLLKLNKYIFNGMTFGFLL